MNRKEAEQNKYNLNGADLREVNFQKAGFEGANFEGASFRKANLWGVNFWGANLRGVNFREANLWGVNFWEANLQRADFWGADLRGVNFWEADLRGAKYTNGIIIGNSPVQILNLEWWVFIMQDHIQIGCEIHSKKDWERFSDKRISLMDSKALEFWRKYKKGILSF